MILNVYNTTTHLLLEARPLNERGWDCPFLCRNEVGEVCLRTPTKSGAAAVLGDALLQFCIYSVSKGI